MHKVNTLSSLLIDKTRLPTLARAQESIETVVKPLRRLTTIESTNKIEKPDDTSILSLRLAHEEEKKTKKLQTLDDLDHRISALEDEINQELEKQAQKFEKELNSADIKSELMKDIQFELDEMVNIERSVQKLDEDLCKMKVFRDVKGGIFENLLGDYKGVLGIIERCKKPRNCDVDREMPSTRTLNKKSKFYNLDKSNKVSNFNNGR